MILTKKPRHQQIEAFLASQQGRPFSYPEVGGTRAQPPRGYFIDHRRTRLGTGNAAFVRACQALRQWKQYGMHWVELHRPDTPLVAGNTVAIVAGRLGLWSLNACRIVYTFDDSGDVARFGYAYGTLADHMERGEERFTIEWRRDDDSVWYDLFAFSWPNHFVSQCALPYIRRLQKRFAIDSAAAMVAAVGQTFTPPAT
jgi:uncharacterized protein (UPF0548 family)